MPLLLTAAVIALLAALDHVVGLLASLTRPAPMPEPLPTRMTDQQIWRALANNPNDRST